MGIALTHLEIIDEICNREAARNDSNSKKCVFERAHVRAAAVFVFDFNIVQVAVLRQHMTGVEDLVEAIPARVNLQRVREHHQNGNGELPDGYEKRRGWVHCDNICANLDRCVINNSKAV